MLGGHGSFGKYSLSQKEPPSTGMWKSRWWITLNEWKKNNGRPRKLSESEGRKFLQWFPTTLGQKALGPLPGENIESEMNNGTPQSQLMKELEEALAILKLQ